VAEVVPEGDRLGEVLVQPEGTSGGASDLGDVQRVGEPHPVVVPLRRQEDLRLVPKASEGLRVDDPIPVALEDGAQGILGLLSLATLRFGGEHGAWRQHLPFDLLGPLPGGLHPPMVAARPDKAARVAARMTQGRPARKERHEDLESDRGPAGGGGTARGGMLEELDHVRSRFHAEPRVDHVELGRVRESIRELRERRRQRRRLRRWIGRLHPLPGELSLLAGGDFGEGREDDHGVEHEPTTPHTFTVQGTKIDVTNDGGASQDVTIDLKPGTYPFLCRFHQSLGMTGTLVVT
jgi:hypothetical protein